MCIICKDRVFLNVLSTGRKKNKFGNGKGVLVKDVKLQEDFLYKWKF